METNMYARLWYNCIVRGTKTYAECPETIRKYSVKPVVKEMLIVYGHGDLIEEES